MSQWNETPPQLCPMSQCDNCLNFQPLQEWPASLPAVAVNSIVLAGFSQELVFNHQIDAKNSDKIASLFRSLYFELTFVEMSRLILKAKNHSWFPLALIAQKFGWQANEQFFLIADRLNEMPAGFQKWCSDKKVSPLDLLPLLSAGDLDLKFLFHDILQFNLSKSLGVKALELGIELMLMGNKPEEITSQRLLTFIGRDQTPGEAWIETLKHMRFPETAKRDLAHEQKMTSLPWPGTSHAKWTRQGDRAGIELKLFVTQPSDLKKYLQSLSKVQDMLEKESSGTKH